MSTVLVEYYSTYFMHLSYLNDIEEVIPRILYEGLLKKSKVNRRYELSSDEKRLCMVCDHESLNRIRFNKADLVVAVGSGTEVQEFECHSVILSLA